METTVMENQMEKKIETTTMENQMEKKMENEMETGISIAITRLLGLEFRRTGGAF